MSIASCAARSRVSPGAAPDQVRDGREPQDRQGARSCDTPIDSAARRRGHRVGGAHRCTARTAGLADSLDDAKAAFRAAWERRALDRWCAREPGRREGPLSVLFISLVECSYRVPLVEIFGEI